MWDKEESVSEYQLMAEDAQQAEELAEQYASSPGLVDAEEEVLEEISDEAAFELTNTESNVIYNARLRLEQAKLYELLINHNLFEGVDASPQAIKNVQNELKFYIVKRLEILLGLREPTAAKVNTAPAESQFNDVEVEFLKQLAYKGTLGKSIGQPIVANQQQVVKPLTTTPSSGLKSLAKIKKIETTPEVKKTVEQAPQTKPIQKKVAVQPQPKQPAQQPQPKQQPKKAPSKLRPSGHGRDLTQEEILQIAKEDLQTSSNKPFHEMTPKEKAERIRQANERNARNKGPANRMPMPSPAELEMKYATQQQSGAMSKSSTDQFNVAIAQAIAAKKNRGDDNE